MANLVVIQTLDTPKDSRAVINANFAALNTAAGGKHTEQFSNASGQVTITHGLGTQDVIAQAWDADGRAAILDLRVTGPNTISVTFETPFSGRVVVRS